MAFGQLGYNVEEFMTMTPRQFFNAVGGFLEREETKLKESWEQTRIVLTAILNKPVYGYKIRSQDAKTVLPLPWDSEKGKVDEEEVEWVKQQLKNYGKQDGS